MKIIKEEKGITLVALIITIVVLLILAVVAISSIQNDGILGHANNAASQYNQAQANESSILNNYLSFLDDNMNTNKEIEFTIDGVTYKALEGMNFGEWVNTSYNTIGIKISGSGVYYSDGARLAVYPKLNFAMTSDEITERFFIFTIYW